MAGPPDMPAASLWAKLQELPRPSKVVDFPRNGEDGKPIGQLRIRVLTQEEQLICTTAAEKLAREKLKDGKRDEIGYETLYSNALCIEVLFRACRDVEDQSKSAFPTPKEMREKLTVDECGTLFDHYSTVQLELGPLAHSLSDEEIDAWIRRIGEGGSAFPFDTLPWGTQRILVLSMASRLLNSRTDTSSAGSPLEEPREQATDDATA